MNTNFYDIESLDNVFTLANWKPRENEIDVYHLLDEGIREVLRTPGFEALLLKAIYKANPNVAKMKSRIRLLDLNGTEGNDHMFRTFGLSDAYMVNNPNNVSSYPDRYRITCDTDPGYNPETMPYFFGYNSDNYDLTMLAIYADEAFSAAKFGPDAGKMVFGADPRFKVTASLMRRHNDLLFRDFRDCMPRYLRYAYDPERKCFNEIGYKARRAVIHRNFKYTGRHLDVSKLNEKQQKVGLKRMIGQLGGQILESRKLKPGQSHINDLEELLELIAYNVSDVVNLDLIVFRNKLYKSQFMLKRNLIKAYPDMVYEKKEDAYAPNVSPYTVRKDRMYIDSSSAQLSTKALCPYDHLTDIPVVSFLYPAKEKAKELGIKQINVLEKCRDFFYEKFPQPELRANFDRVYDYYKKLEGKNFNEGKNYLEDYGNDPSKYVTPMNVRSIPKGDTSLMYYSKDGTPTSCFVNFSVGGIHGAECNLELYKRHRAEFEYEYWLLSEAKRIYPDPLDLRKAKVVEINGKEYPYKRFLTGKSSLKAAEYRDLAGKEPQLFQEKDGNTVLNPKYTYTSADQSVHEDFTSYYPNLLRMLLAFYNKGLGYDRYAEIFDNKQNYGFLMKKKNANLTPEQAEKYRKLREGTGLRIDPLVVSDEERGYYADMREGTKLVLNSASGAADANFESPIRMNNMIISMRIIGQMFTYMIGQSQAYEGSRIISTNTDGLYSVMDVPGFTWERNMAFNNEILEREAANIGVEIEPEPIYLISKDTNNRMEVDGKDIVTGAGGASLACYLEPLPTKSLAHPAILDWAMTEYLLYSAKDYDKRGLSLSSPFDRNVARNILDAAKDYENPNYKDGKKPFEGWKMLRMYQNILASSVGSVTYIYGTKPDNPTEPVILQHYNRAFIVKDAGPDTLNLHAACGRKVTPVVKAKRIKAGDRICIHDPIAAQVLEQNGVNVTDIEDIGGNDNREAIVKKINGIEEDWNILIVNDDLTLYDESQIQSLLDRLDYDKYLELMQGTYERSWYNPRPDEEPESGDENDGQGTERPKAEPKKKPKPDRPKKEQATKRETGSNRKAEAKALTMPPVIMALYDGLEANLSLTFQSLESFKDPLFTGDESLAPFLPDRTDMETMESCISAIRETLRKRTATAKDE